MATKYVGRLLKLYRNIRMAEVKGCREVTGYKYYIYMNDDDEMISKLHYRILIVLNKIIEFFIKLGRDYRDENNR
jgi:hypothetical protein